jgi:transcriptional regulator with XRE-family HTH domain
MGAADIALPGDAGADPAVAKRPKKRFPMARGLGIVTGVFVNSHTHTFIRARIKAVKGKLPPKDTSAKPLWAQKIRDLRRRLGVSQAELAGRVGLSQVTISRWESGDDEPNGSGYAQLARVAGDPDCWYFWERIGVTKDDVARAMPGLEQPRTEVRVEVQPARGALHEEGRRLKKKPDVVAVALLKDSAAAGSPRMIQEAEIERVILADAHDCPHPDDMVAIRIAGDSMSPVLETGYIAVIDTAVHTAKELVGHMVAARDPEGAVTIKWLRDVEGRLMLLPQHTSLRFPPIFLHPGWELIGEVVWWIGRPAY